MRILRDNKEKKGYWTFGKTHPCKSTHLKTGDYTLEGYEDVLALERKKCVSEVHKNLHKKDAKRFWAEMDRLAEFEHPYLLFEFTVDDMMKYPFNLPRYISKKIRIRGPYLYKQVQKIEDMGIKVIFCGDRQGAIDVAWKIFQSMINE